MNGRPPSSAGRLQRLLWGAAAIAACVTGLYASLMTLLLAPLPRTVAAFAAGYLAVASILVPLAAVVRRWRPSAMARSRQGLRAALVVTMAIVCVTCAAYIDWPTRPDPLPRELQEVLGTDSTDVLGCYVYDLGGFIDREWLWRIDGPPDLVTRIVTALHLRRADRVPPMFWRMPPHYWPRSQAARGEAFESAAFPADGRGPDGPHYFLMYDPGRARAFVWFKNNF